MMRTHLRFRHFMLCFFGSTLFLGGLQLAAMKIRPRLTCPSGLAGSRSLWISRGYRIGVVAAKAPSVPELEPICKLHPDSASPL